MNLLNQGSSALSREEQMLLKAIPEAGQQALVTDRVLSSMAIIYRLLVRFHPGGAGEKQLLLSQLTTISKGKDINEVAAATGDGTTEELRR